MRQTSHAGDTGPGSFSKPQASAAVHNVSTRLGLGFIGPADPTALVSSLELSICGFTVPFQLGFFVPTQGSTFEQLLTITMNYYEPIEIPLFPYFPDL